jgi:hypothetical protein
MRLSAVSKRSAFMLGGLGTGRTGLRDGVDRVELHIAAESPILLYVIDFSPGRIEIAFGIPRISSVPKTFEMSCMKLDLLKFLFRSNWVLAPSGGADI